MRPGAPGPAELARALRLIVITDRRLTRDRSLTAVVDAALEAGCRAVQVRDKEVGARELLALVRELLPRVRAWGGLLFVNDRLDVALAAGADGVHLGPDDLPLAAARRVTPPGFLLGWSTDDPREARRAQEAGADYLGCGAVFGTTTKDVGGEAIGTDRLDAVARAVTVPVVGIGGVTPEGAERVARTAAAGVAVIGAVMGAADPGSAVRALLTPFERRGGRSTPDGPADPGGPTAPGR